MKEYTILIVDIDLNVLQTIVDFFEESRKKLKSTLLQKTGARYYSDGMDMAICIINIRENKLQYSGAYLPLYLIRNGELIEFKATRNPVGQFRKEKAFDTNYIDIKKNDILYMFSDGFIDQIGGGESKRFKSSQLKKRLIDIHNKPLSNG